MAHLKKFYFLIYDTKVIYDIPCPNFDLFQVYSIESMKYYGEKKLTEGNVPEPFKDIPDDFLQVSIKLSSVTRWL